MRRIEPVPRDADIVIVGAGITGIATARELARSGRRVVVLEQFTVGNARGSSHGTTRIFRLSYDDERYIRLASAALGGWRELEAEAGVELIHRVGALDLGQASIGIARALGASGVACERLSGAEVRKRWPIVCVDDEAAVFQADGGVLRADVALGALAESARALGVELLDETRVVAIERDRVAMRAVLENGTSIGCNAVVVAAGAWADRLVRPLAVELPVVPTRETIAYVARTTELELPTVIDYNPLAAAHVAGLERAGEAWYALGLPGGELKIGLHHGGPVTDPDTNPAPDAAIADAAVLWARDRFDGVADSVSTETCIYTNTADQSFVLERHGRLVVGSACSGHGFKFAPQLGKTLAALALEAAQS